MDTIAGPAALTVAVLLAALGLKITDFVKYIVSAIRDNGAVRTDSINGIVTLLASSILGFLVVEFMLKPSAWGDEIMIGEEPLKDLGFGSTLIFGIVFTALASTLYDFKKAVDVQDDAKKPKLVEPKMPSS